MVEGIINKTFPQNRKRASQKEKKKKSNGRTVGNLYSDFFSQKKVKQNKKETSGLGNQMQLFEVNEPLKIYFVWSPSSYSSSNVSLMGFFSKH